MKRYSVILILITAILCFWGASASHRALMYERTLHRADYAPPPETMSPLMAFTTVALGGFRGVITDLLWLRGIELQAQGRFFELAQLADWITKLEPHFVPVWAFHSWNMAYNISNLFPEPEDRWRWIQHSVHLLRDEGLRLNPRHPELHWELAWLYQHKIGYFMDPAHWYYKIRLATEMQALLNGQGPEELDPDAESRLRREYRLYPDVMRTVNERYGPLDWRHPSTHALYWAYRGKTSMRVRDGAHLAPAIRRALINCERTILQSVSVLFRQGNLLVEPDSGLFVTSPMFEMLPYAVQSYEAALERHDLHSFQRGYLNFLANAVLILYCYGHTEEAETLFAVLLEKYGAGDQSPSFEAYIKSVFELDFEEIDRDIAMAMTEGAMFQACLMEAMGQDEQAETFARQAELTWTGYMDSRADEDHLRRTGLPPMPVIWQSARERAARVLSQRKQKPARDNKDTGL